MSCCTCLLDQVCAQPGEEARVLGGVGDGTEGDGGHDGRVDRLASPSSLTL